MVVMEGLTYHMIRHCNKFHIFIFHIRSYSTPEVYKLYQSAMPFTAKNLFGDKYLSQDLIVISRNITQLCQVRQRGVGEGGEPSLDRLLAFMNTYPAITRH